VRPARKRILFVDDDVNVLKSLERMLREKRNDWEMHFAESAEQAMRLLKGGGFDAAVLDVRLRGKSGLELLMDIKSDENMRDMEVVMITGLRDRGLKSKALDLGATDLLAKPVTKEDLIARLSNVLCLRSCLSKLRSDNIELEKRLIMSQKMEMMGLLSAGVMHDLNNILLAITGYGDLAMLQLPENSKAREYVEKIRSAGERAAMILGEIRNLSRHREVGFEQCELKSVVENCLELLSPLTPKGVEVRWRSGKGRTQVEADPSQMYQLVLNLCTNAFQAMKEGGVLEVSLDETEEVAGSASAPEGNGGGSYVKLEVSDTGTGMDEETLDRVFEPFFTTKASDGGTGLGMAVVRWIVEAHGGHVKVQSELGRGTKFEVYLPRERRGEELTVAASGGESDGREEAGTVCR